MTNIEFINKLIQLANSKTVYMLGCFGQPVSKSIITQKTKQIPKWYTETRVQNLSKYIGTGTFAFDCVGMIKGVLWGFDYSLTKSNGGAKYVSNDVADISADQMIKLCQPSSDFTEYIEPGEAVWLSGHIGVYIGDGKVVECSPKWKNGVQITEISQRAWKKHGKLPYIQYDKQPVLTNPVMLVNTKISNLNVRETPNGALVGSFKKGTKVKVIDASRSDWLLVEGRDVKTDKTIRGWCSSKYLV